MRKKEKDEIALFNIDRNPVFIIVSVIVSIILDYLSYTWILNLIPWGFVMLIPAAFFSFHTIWFILTPYALFYEDKLEIKKNLFSNNMLFFVDVKKVGEISKNNLSITYNDEELSVIKLTGIKSNQKTTLKSELEKQVAISISKRN